LRYEANVAQLLTFKELAQAFGLKTMEARRIVRAMRVPEEGERVSRALFEYALRLWAAGYGKGTYVSPVHGLQRSDAELPPSAETLGLGRDVVVAVRAEGQTLYRLVSRDPPTGRDFQSNLARGKPRFEGQTAISHAGLSMWETATKALSGARRFPALVAEVPLVAEGASLAKTFGPGHYTVWLPSEFRPLRAAIEIHERRR
jgi:hypothetical protein